MRSGRDNLSHLTLTLSELTNAIVVPSQAVQTGQNGQFIYVVKTDQGDGCGNPPGENRHHVSRVTLLWKAD